MCVGVYLPHTPSHLESWPMFKNDDDDVSVDFPTRLFPFMAPNYRNWYRTYRTRQAIKIQDSPDSKRKPAAKSQQLKIENNLK